MNLQPTLTGSQLSLRPLKDTDFAALFESASDPLIWQLHPQNDRYKKEVFESYFTKIMSFGGALAVNLGPLMNAVQSTFGLTPYGVIFGI